MNISRKRKAMRSAICAASMLVILLLFAGKGNAQVPVALAPSMHPQFLDATGKVLAGGFLYTYQPGTTTRQDTYTDSSGAIINAWPIPLDATGAPSNLTTQTGIWLSNQAYKFCGYNSAMVLQWCTDNVSAYQILNNVQNIVFGSVISDPTGAAGEIGYRSDLGCFRFFASFWDCGVTFTGIQTLTNKTVSNPTITGPTITGTITGAPTITGPTLTAPIITGTPTGAALQGTDTKLLTSGTISGTGAFLCTDALGGATTTACGATGANITPYSTASASTTGSIGSTTMATAGGSGNKYTFTALVTQTAVGASCAGTSTVQLNVAYTDAVTGSAVNAAMIGTGTVGGGISSTPALAVGGNGSVNNLIFYLPMAINLKASTNLSYSTTYSGGSSCSPNPAYYVTPLLVQVQ